MTLNCVNLKPAIRFLVFAGTWLGLSVLLGSVEPAMAKPFQGRMANNPSQNPSQNLSQVAAPSQTTRLAQAAEPARVNLETQLQPQADGRITGELSFAGNANEILIIHVPRNTGLRNYYQSIELYNADGESVNVSRNYPDYINFEPYNDHYWTILIPDTGTYRLTFIGQVADADNNESSESDPNYTLQVRSATYYERLLISADNLFDNDQYDSAFDLWALAVADSPDIPSAYLYRLFAHAKLLYDSPEFQSKVDNILFDSSATPEELENTLFPLIHENFLTLAAEEQTLIISDLRQLHSLVSTAIARDEIEPTEYALERLWFAGIADFLETGVPTDTMRQLFFGSVQAAEEPVILQEEVPPAEEESVEETVVEEATTDEVLPESP